MPRTNIALIDACRGHGRHNDHGLRCGHIKTHISCGMVLPIGPGQRIPPCLTRFRVFPSAFPGGVVHRFLSFSAAQRTDYPAAEAAPEPRDSLLTESTSRISAHILRETRAAIDRWVQKHREPNALGISFVFLAYTQMQDLWATLPTGKGRKDDDSKHDCRIPWGHHVIYRYGTYRLESLRLDGSDPYLTPPVPTWRRRWVGGEMSWPSTFSGGLYLGRSLAEVRKELGDVSVRNFAEGGTPTVVVTQHAAWHKTKLASRQPMPVPSVEETRIHAYSPLTINHEVQPGRHIITRGSDVTLIKILSSVAVPESVDFKYEFFPTPTMLFRFSALTFNAHRIHIDKEYATQVEGYPGEFCSVLYDPHTSV